MGSHQRCCDTALRGIIGNQPLIPGIAKFLASRDARFVRPYNQLKFNYYARTHESCVPTIWAKFVGSAPPFPHMVCGSSAPPSQLFGSQHIYLP